MGFPLLYTNQMAQISASLPHSARSEFCAFIVSAPDDETGRKRMFDELSKYKRVHSYDRVRNNMPFPGHTGAFIDFDDYGSFERVAARVKELDRDDDQYHRMQKESFFRPGFFEALENEKKRFMRSVYRHILAYRCIRMLRRPARLLRPR